MANDHERFRKMVESSQDIFWEFDNNAVFTYVSPSSKKLLGYEPEELIGLNAFDLMESEEAERVHAHFDPVAKKYLPFNHLVNINLHKDGHEVVIESSGTPIFDKDGQFLGYRGIDRDISERKRTEDKLRNSQQRFKDITAQSPLPIVITDANGDIEFFNNRFIEVFGYTLDDVSTAEQWWRAAYPDEAYRQKVQESWAKAIDLASERGTQIETQVWNLTCKNGSVRYVEFDMTPLDDIAVIVMNDITDRKKAEDALKTVNEELDAFVYTISHDLRSSITPIIGYADLLREDYRENLGKEGLSFLTEIERAGTGMLHLMHSLLELARSGSPGKPAETVSTDEVVAEVIKNLSAEIAKTGVSLQVDPLPSVYIAKSYLIQIFDNLIGNAIRYACKGGDAIQVGGEKTGTQIRFFVRDHGPGIPEQERKHVFEIFYQGVNNDKGKGKGVGLAIVHKVVRNCGGKVWVEETPGGGCTFWVEIEESNH